MKDWAIEISAASIVLVALVLFGLLIYDGFRVVEVRLIRIVETNPNEGAWTRRPTYAIYERTDTKERITSYVYGEEGETFKLQKRRL